MPDHLESPAPPVAAAENGGNGRENLVTYDLATLTSAEVLRVRLRGRFPHARDPVRRWVLTILGLVCCLSMLGFLVGMATWPRFRIDTMALAFGMAVLVLPILTLTRLPRARRRLSEEGLCTTELTAEGIIRRTLTRECKYRWLPGQTFVVRGNDVLLFVRGGEMLWMPRRAFSSPDAMESFLQAARRHHADAMAHR